MIIDDAFIIFELVSQRSSRAREREGLLYPPTVKRKWTSLNVSGQPCMLLVVPTLSSRGLMLSLCSTSGKL